MKQKKMMKSIKKQINKTDIKDNIIPIDNISRISKKNSSYLYKKFENTLPLPKMVSRSTEINPIEKGIKKEDNKDISKQYIEMSKEYKKNERKSEYNNKEPLISKINLKNLPNHYDYQIKSPEKKCS